MIKQEFSDNETYLPVTMEQFESLANEMLTAFNVISAPHFLNADIMATVVHSSIHHLNHSIGIIKKSELFDACVNRISNNLTFRIAEGIRQKMELEEVQRKAANGEVPLKAVPDSEPG
jgi:hypothetical protein